MHDAVGDRDGGRGIEEHLGPARVGPRRAIPPRRGHTPATPPHKAAHTATGGTGLASGWTRITPD